MGSNEEGIGGAGARIALVGPNSKKVSWCGITTGRRFESFEKTVNKSTYFFDRFSGMLEIHFDGKINESNSREEGIVSLKEVSDSNTLKYMRLLDSDTKKALQNIYDSKKCEDIQP